MVDSHSADEEVIPQMARVVIGQVDHQVNISLVDQPINTNSVRDNRIKPINVN